MAPSARDNGSNGLWDVASRAIIYDYLWNEVRVKGGAYGCGFRRLPTGVEQFWSYRDPGVDGTVGRFEQAGSWLEGWEADEDELAGYIVSVVASHDAPLKARRLARRQDGLYFSERPDGWRDQIRQEELEASVEGIRALAPAVSEISERRALCVFGARELIEASTLDLDVKTLLG